MTMSDRIAVMNLGRIEQLGRPEEVYERPATQFVAEFLGASNLLEGVYRGISEGWGSLQLDGGATIRIPANGEARVGTRLKAGVRPEKIHVYPAGVPLPDGENVMTATLRSAVFVGVSYQYFFDTSLGRQITAFDRNAGAGAVGRAGDSVRLGWRPDHTFVIPAEGTTDRNLNEVGIKGEV